MSKRRTTIDIMKIQYCTYQKDWMGFKVTKENPLTFHHIKKEEDGGHKTVDNGALLTKLAHRYLHNIEHYDMGLYEWLNSILKRINNSKSEPQKEDYREIIEVLERFEHEYVKELSSNIKIRRYNYEALKKVSTGKYSLYSPTNIRNAMMDGIDPEIRKVRKPSKSKVKKKVRKK